MTAVLVTGASGFIGRRVCQAAEGDGYCKVPVARRPLGTGSLALDLRGSLDRLPRVDWVFHLAGEYAGASYETLRQADLEITTRLIEWGRRARVRNWVFASAAEVYGGCAAPASETSPTTPVIPYGQVKLQIERMLRRLSEEVPGSRVAILRIGEVYGREGTLITELTRRFRSGFCPWFGDGRVPVSFAHADDVARSFWVAARSAPPGISIWNIADDEPTTWREFLDGLACLLGTRRAAGLPLSLSRVYAAVSTAAAVMRRRPPVVTQHIVTLLTTPKPLSNQRAVAELEWRPRYPEWRSGLRDVVRE